VNGAWAAMSGRERRAVLLGIGALASAGIYLGLIEPAGERLAAERALRESQSALLAMLDQAAAEARALRGTSGGGLGGRALLAVCDEAAGKAGIRGAIRRITPDGEQRVRLNVDGVAFPDLMRWLTDLRRNYGVTVVEISVSRAGSPGAVEAGIVLDEYGRK
jgi:general secretion pathway protein M